MASIYRAKLGMLGRTTTPWQNIVIDGGVGPGNIVQEAYLDDICNFWDSLDYYIDLTPSDETTTTATHPSDKTTTTASAVSHVADDVTTATEVTTSRCKQSRPSIFAIYLLCLLFIQITT